MTQSKDVRLESLVEGLSPEFVRCDPRSRPTDVCGDWEPALPGSAVVRLRDAPLGRREFLESSALVQIIDRSAQTPATPYVAVCLTPTSYAQVFARWHRTPGSSLSLIGVTGTNGKSTIVHLLWEVYRSLGLVAGMIGTVGINIGTSCRESLMTTYYPPTTQRVLAEMRTAGVSHASMEVSSHGLAEERLSQLDFDGVGFASFSRDHLDYHGSMNAYLRAKCRLPSYAIDRGVAVVATDQNPGAAAFIESCKRNDLEVWRVSRNDPVEIHVRRTWSELDRSVLEVTTPRAELTIRTPLFGEHNVSNVLVALGLVLWQGFEPASVAAGLSQAKGPRGRLQHVPQNLLRVGAPAVYIDYAHTPHALESVCRALRGRCSGRLWLVIGCGGDRDRGKRPVLGAVAARECDAVLFTADNPRSEDPAAICIEMLQGVPHTNRHKTQIVTNRRNAIARAVRESKYDDVVLVAGKGHEALQIIGERRLPFSDYSVVLELIGVDHTNE